MRQFQYLARTLPVTSSSYIYNRTPTMFGVFFLAVKKPPWI
ncbi:hypothetical protein ACE1TG_06350 [Virgibacillus sp. JSM 102003]